MDKTPNKKKKKEYSFAVYLYKVYNLYYTVFNGKLYPFNNQPAAKEKETTRTEFRSILKIKRETVVWCVYTFSIIYAYTDDYSFSPRSCGEKYLFNFRFSFLVYQLKLISLMYFSVLEHIVINIFIICKWLPRVRIKLCVYSFE